MSQAILDLVEKTSLKETTPEFEIGDTVDVHLKILEGNKERIQVFTGVVLGRSGSGSREMFAVPLIKLLEVVFGARRLETIRRIEMRTVSHRSKAVVERSWRTNDRAPPQR